MNNNYIEYNKNLKCIKVSKALDTLIIKNVIDIDFILNKIFLLNEYCFGELDIKESIKQVKSLNDLKADTIRAIWSIKGIKLEFKKFFNCELDKVFYEVNILY